MILAHHNLRLSGSSNSSSHQDYRHVLPHPAIFLFSIETGFLCVGQAGLELLISGDPLALASQSVVITGVSHCILPTNFNRMGGRCVAP